MRWTVVGLALGGLVLGGVTLGAGMPSWWTRSRPQAAPPAPAADTAFEQDVRPILTRRCKPCHEPGGVMYGRIPFDDPKAVRDHREGILRRIKEPREAEALRNWLGAGTSEPAEPPT